MKVLKRLRSALSYVTICHLTKEAPTEDDLRGLAKYLPVVGLLIGSLLSAESFALHSFCPASIESLLLLVSWTVLTGAIHLDGLMDTADGVFSHRDRNRMLEIMHDSRTGNFGAVTGTLLLLCKFAALSSVSSTLSLAAALLIVPAWARWCEVVVIGCYPYARDYGMGKIWHESTSVPKDLIISAALPLAATIAIGMCVGQTIPGIAAASIATIICGCLASTWFNSKLGGQTGDTYGATVELAEAGGLLVASIAASMPTI